MKRFSKSFALDVIEREMAVLEEKHKWTRNHIGTGEIDRRPRDTKYALDVGRYTGLCDVFDALWG